jgi:large subunit ribosomal protein L21
MIAVIRTGGKQYTVAPDDTLTIERIAGEAGAQIEFPRAVVDDKVGAPTVAGPRFWARSSSGRAGRTWSSSKRRRQNSRRRTVTVRT